MARLIVCVLALLLPLQFSWGAVLAYSQQETAPAQAEHVGHQAQEHEHKAPQPAGDQADADCGACHVSSLTGLPGPGLCPPAGASREALAPALPHLYPSAPQRTPDRPQWPRLA